MLQILLVLILVILFVTCIVGYYFLWLFNALFDSIQPTEPAKRSQNLAPGEPEPNPLFRQFPNLRHKLSWEPLGIFPTPLHCVNLIRSGKTISFWMKREDLCSPRYGGNKVRTLQYPLASCKIFLQQNPSSQFYITGSGGSNQVVATLVHGRQAGLPMHVCMPAKDAPDLDNTLNLLSALSLLPNSLATWDKVWPQVRTLTNVLLSKTDKVFGPGGNSLGGILGQMGGALELAEQIAASQMPDVDEIYLPMGSSCTTTGLILGVCLARHLKLNAFKSHRFKIVSVMIHGGFAFLQRKTNFMRNVAGSYISVSPAYGIHATSTFFKKLTGIDLEPAALKFMEQEWELVDDPEIVGDYGGHSLKSKAASGYDVDLEISGECPDWVKESRPPAPWLCGHFTGKSFAVMLERLEKDDGKIALFWQTKSNVQPLGEENEWPEFQRRAHSSKIIKTWANDGKAASVLRPGKVDVDNGSPSDYRGAMTKL